MTRRGTFGARPPAADPDKLVSNMTSPEKIKRLNIEIPLSLHRRVKTGCAREELAIADVVRELLDRRFPADPDAASRSPRRRGRAVDGAHGSTPRGTP